MNPSIAIVILNWSGRDDTLACLESVDKIAYPDFRVIVVDNGSADDSVAAIRAAFPEVDLIETTKGSIKQEFGLLGDENVFDLFAPRYAFFQ